MMLNRKKSCYGTVGSTGHTNFISMSQSDWTVHGEFLEHITTIYGYGIVKYPYMECTVQI